MQVDRQRLKDAARVVGRAAATIAVRVAAWGALGAGLGLFAAGVELLSPLLDAPPSWWSLARLVVLVVYPVGGAVLFAHLGVARGIGRVLLFHAVDQGLVIEVLDRLLELAGRAAGRSARLSALADRAEVFAAELPLADAERALKQAGDEFVLGSDLEGGGAGRWVMRRLKRALVHAIERVTLRVVRAEEGGVSLERVRRLALEQAEAGVRDAILSTMKKQLLLAAALLALLVATGPLLAAVLRAR
ncbi:MAG: hypothetical protein IT374_00730 [Polyangiaceae bacterium]|nr:hypothetical protein [Polyangiaceae bacterium]